MTEQGSSPASTGSGRHPQPPVQSVTDAPASAFDDQSDRIRRYFLTMGFRGVCFVLAIVFDGWLRWAFVAGAVVLPYVAVVLANAVGPKTAEHVVRVDPRSRRTQALTGTIADAPTVPGSWTSASGGARDGETPTGG